MGLFDNWKLRRKAKTLIAQASGLGERTATLAGFIMMTSLTSANALKPLLEARYDEKECRLQWADCVHEYADFILHLVCRYALAQWGDARRQTIFAELWPMLTKATLDMSFAHADEETKQAVVKEMWDQFNLRDREYGRASKISKARVMVPASEVPIPDDTVVEMLVEHIAAHTKSWEGWRTGQRGEEIMTLQLTAAGIAIHSNLEQMVRDLGPKSMKEILAGLGK